MTGENQLPTSSYAIASVAVGIGGLFILGIPCGIAAIILAAVAKKSVDQGQQQGIGLIVAGMILGVVDIAGYLACEMILTEIDGPKIPTYVL